MLRDCTVSAGARLEDVEDVELLDGAHAVLGSVDFLGGVGLGIVHDNLLLELWSCRL